jgi:hypothetical protein
MELIRDLSPFVISISSNMIIIKKKIINGKKIPNK